MLLRLVTLCVLLAGCHGGDAAAPAPSAGPRPIAIAVVPFALMPGSPPPPVDVADVIRTDLAASGRFAPTQVGSMPERPSDPADIRFEDWRPLAVDYLVVGRVGMVHDGGHDVEYQVVDARTQATVFGFQVPSAPDDLPRTAREIATVVRQRISG